MVKLVELFDRHVDWEWTTFMGNPAAAFEVDGVQYIVGFNEYDSMVTMGGGMFPPLKYRDVTLAGFAANIDGQWRQDDVGGNNPRAVSQVIFTFLKILETYIQQERPKVLAIPAVTDRERVYAQIAKRVGQRAGELGYEEGEKEEATFPHFGRSVVFYFVRKDD